jgi:DNA-binding transcriptional LysR family regulator
MPRAKPVRGQATRPGAANASKQRIARRGAAASAAPATGKTPRKTAGALDEARTWLSLRMLEVFVAVVRQDGLTAAARQLGMTQSAVSQIISALENGLGAQLIDRSTRPPRLTLLGATFHERAVEVLRQARSLERALEVQQNARLPHLRIGMVDSFASTAGPHLLKRVASMAARWSVASGVAETTLQALAERRVDAIITSEEIERHNDYVVLPILREPLVIVAPKGVRAKDAPGAAGRAIADLAQRLPLVRYGANALLGRQVSAYLMQHDLALGREYEFDSSDAVLAMVKAGLGWTITTPLCVLKSHWARADFEYLPVRPNGMQRSLVLVAHRDEHEVLWQRISSAAQDILRADWIPAIKRLAPWASVAVA